MENTVQTTLKELLNSFGASYSEINKIEVAGQVVFNIQTDDARTLIGMHGDTVYAIDHLVKKITEQKLPNAAASASIVENDAGDTDPVATTRTNAHGGMQFLVDVNDYRAKQIRDLQTKALMMAERARSFQYDVELTPMSAYERLIIHTALAGAPNVKTESLGEGRNRRVVIKYAA
ncbi:MAG: R3H domain-containing nucleic acid-binding protein [bacterium]|nr:R3H domain-containing nucleic acid-binding protein [bacterium]